MFRYFLIILIACQGSSAAAQGFQDLRADWRELCRQEVGGLYLQHLDQRHLAEDHLKRALIQIEKLNVHLAAAQKDLGTMQEHLRQNPFNTDLAQQHDNLDGRVKILQAQRDDFLALAEQATRRRDAAIMSYQTFSRRVQGLFLVRQDPKLAGRGYPVAVQYRDSCPEFRNLCPLSATNKRHLEAIFTPEAPSTACQKYLQIN